MQAIRRSDAATPAVSVTVADSPGTSPSLCLQDGQWVEA